MHKLRHVRFEHIHTLTFTETYMFECACLNPNMKMGQVVQDGFKSLADSPASSQLQCSPDL